MTNLGRLNTKKDEMRLPKLTISFHHKFELKNPKKRTISITNLNNRAI